MSAPTLPTTTPSTTTRAIAALRRCRRVPVLGLALAAFALLAPASPAGEPPSAEASALLDRALPDADQRPRRGGELFEAVLASDLFLSGEVGPFRVHVLVGDDAKAAKRSQQIFDDVLEGLVPAVEVLRRNWPEGGGGLVSEAQLPLVIVDAPAPTTEFHQLIALLDHCERNGYSGWHPYNQVDTPANRGAEVVRTWKVQLFNVGHPVIAERLAEWVEHGVGYYSLAFTANRALRRGSWGMVPPWLANGLIDELDIAAYGKAWVGQESWVAQTPGWFRPGWAGFVPQGQVPPPPVTGPPADLGVTVKDTGDPWLSFKNSTERHWTTLVADRKTEAPASFARAAATESFLPRDRAAARLLVHLMLAHEDPERPKLTALLDDEVRVPADGMPDSEALTVLFARALGGVPEVDRLESITSRELLTELGRDDLIQRLEKHGAGDALELSDHRQQSSWLMRKPHFAGPARNELFQAFMEIEHVQQLAQWRALSPRLDAGLVAALESSRKYPRRAKDMGEVLEAFRAGLAAEPVSAEEAEESDSSSKSKSKSTKSRRRSRRR